MITDDSVVDVSTKSERLETLTNPKIEQEPAEPGSFQGSRSDRALRIAAYGYWLLAIPNITQVNKDIQTSNSRQPNRCKHDVQVFALQVFYNLNLTVLRTASFVSKVARGWSSGALITSLLLQYVVYRSTQISTRYTLSFSTSLRPWTLLRAEAVELTFDNLQDKRRFRPTFLKTKLLASKKKP